MEVNFNFVLFEEFKEKPDGTGAEARIVIIRECRDSDSSFENEASGSHSLE